MGDRSEGHSRWGASTALLLTLTPQPPLVWEGRPRLNLSEQELSGSGTSWNHQSQGGPQHRDLRVGFPIKFESWPHAWGLAGVLDFAGQVLVRF